MKIAVVTSNTAGCRHDLEVLLEALAAILPSGTAVQRIEVPWDSVNWSREAVERHLKLEFAPDCVFFIESVVDHGGLLGAPRRVLLPNPEYLESGFLHLAGQCNHVWHKSRVSLQSVAAALPDAHHSYTGFSSIDPGCRVSGYSSFLHGRGGPGTMRNTESLFTSWRRHREWPMLHVMSHGGSANKGNSLEDEPQTSNIDMQSAWLERDEFLRAICRHGIHLCVSEVEGFGHHLNEARALAALTVTTDGPPMNELFDTDCAVLVRPSAAVPMNFGKRYLVSPPDLEVAIGHVLDLDLAARQRLGSAARQRYEYERAAFHQRVHASFEFLCDQGAL